MIKSGLKNEKKVQEINVSGSLVIKTKNEYGVHIFSASKDDDGIIFGKLTKPKYNKSELVKSIDTTIIELLPIEAPQLPDTILRSIYNPVTQSVIDLTKEVERLNGIVINLNGKIKELEIVSQSLRVELDSRDLLVASAQNQSSLSTNKVQSSIVDLQNAIQKATAEAIQRVSLTAITKALESENATLREQLFGKQASKDEGAKVTDDFAVKVVNKSEIQYADLTFRARAKDDGRGTWINGPELNIKNFTKNSVTVTFAQDGEISGIFNSIPSITLGGNEERNITLKTIDSKIKEYTPKNGFGFRGDTEYKGNIVVKSSSGTINVPVSLQKMRGDKWQG
jgi:hypothetical protein